MTHSNNTFICKITFKNNSWVKLQLLTHTSLNYLSRLGLYSINLTELGRSLNKHQKDWALFWIANVHIAGYLRFYQWRQTSGRFCLKSRDFFADWNFVQNEIATSVKDSFFANTLLIKTVWLLLYIEIQ